MWVGSSPCIVMNADRSPFADLNVIRKGRTKWPALCVDLARSLRTTADVGEFCALRAKK